MAPRPRLLTPRRPAARSGKQENNPTYGQTLLDSLASRPSWSAKYLSTTFLFFSKQRFTAGADKYDYFAVRDNLLLFFFSATKTSMGSRGCRTNNDFKSSTSRANFTFHIVALSHSQFRFQIYYHFCLGLHYHLVCYRTQQWHWHWPHVWHHYIFNYIFNINLYQPHLMDWLNPMR